VAYRAGQRTRPDDDGHWLSVLVNTMAFGALALFATWPAWNAAGFQALVLGGVLGMVLGRFSLLRGIRMVGPTRGNTFQAATPITAAITGWIVLGETISALEALGGAITIVGLLRIVRSRTGGVGDDSVGGEVMGAGASLKGYVVASGAPLFFGIAFVVRKWGLERYPGSVTGAFVGAVAAVVLLSLWEAWRGLLAGRVRSAVTDTAWPFVWAGVITTGALLSQFLALERIEAWIVGIVNGTTAVFTAILSRVFLPGDERLTAALLVNVLIVFAGISVIAVG